MQVFKFPLADFVCVGADSIPLGFLIVNLNLNTVDKKINNTNTCDRKNSYSFQSILEYLDRKSRLVDKALIYNREITGLVKLV